jgi:hypothetical protein
MNQRAQELHLGELGQIRQLAGIALARARLSVRSRASFHNGTTRVVVSLGLRTTAAPMR